MDLSIVVVNWNSGDALDSLLESVEGFVDEIDSLIVVDNHSDDASSRPDLRFSWVRTLALSENRGFAAAANLGIEIAPSSFVLLLNPDLLLQEEAVCRLYELAAEHSNAAIVCGGLLDEDGSSQESFQIRSLPSVWSVLSDALFIDELLRLLPGRRKPGSSEVAQTPRKVDQPAAACWLLRKAAWKEVGGFDEEFFPAWWEDVDLCKRFKDRGFEAWFDPSVGVIHRGGYSVGVFGRAKFLDCYYRNLLRYWRKHHPVSFPLVWGPVHLGRMIRLLMVSEQ